jgi:Acetyltransferases, including N-acetylases of ribosomal proteins
MNHSLKGEYGRIILRPLEAEEIEELRLLRNRERKWFKSSDEISSQAQKEWYRRYCDTNNDYMFAVCLKEEPQTVVGYSALYNIDFVKKEGEFGRLLIDKEKSGLKGLGVDVSAATCLTGFGALELEKIYLSVYEKNISAVKTYERCGFSVYKTENAIKYMAITKFCSC